MDISGEDRKHIDGILREYEELKRTMEILRAGLSLTDHTITVVDIRDHTLSQIHNDGEWLGVTDVMHGAPESIIATGIIHEDDCDGYRDFYERIYSGEPSGEYTMRVKEVNRGWVWFTMYYKTIFSEDGAPLYAVCFSDDITIQKKAEEKHNQFKQAVTAMSDYFWEINLSKDTVISADRKMSRIFKNAESYSYTQLSTMAAEYVKDPLYKGTVQAFYNRDQLIDAYHRAKLEISLEHPFVYSEEEGLRWLHTTAYLITNLQEEVILMLCSKDVTEAHNERQNLEHKAMCDDLTGLLNRNAYEHQVSSILAEDSFVAHGFIMFDVDHFKRFNDTYGHAYGDKILKMLSEIFVNNFRSTDTLSRFGGDEFSLFLIDVRAMDIDKALEKLVKEIEERCIEEGLPEAVTLSVGVTLSVPTDDFDSLYKRADDALYRSKANGRNQISYI